MQSFVYSLSDGVFNIPDCRVFKSRNWRCKRHAKHERFSILFHLKLMEDYQVDKVVIRQRQTKGKFAGGGFGFKLKQFS